MNWETLVLDATYEPMYRTTWEEAISMIHKGLVYTVAEYEDDIHSVKLTMRVPAVVVFKSPKKVHKRSVKFSRENLYLRDEGRCQYCGDAVARSGEGDSRFQYEHVTPRAQGGQTTWENIVVACNDCNQRKGNRTPEQAGMKLLKQPVKPRNLPGVYRSAMRYKDHMPEIWRTFLDWEYWEGELDEEP